MRRIVEVKDAGNDTLSLTIENAQGKVEREIFRVNDLALIDLIEVAQSLAAQR